jgi:hypothetical protein
MSHLPAVWEFVQEVGGLLYYVSGSTLYRLNPANMSETALNDGATDPLNGAADPLYGTWLHATPGGDVYTMWAANSGDKKFKIYFVDGSTYDFSSADTGSFAWMLNDAVHDAVTPSQFWLTRDADNNLWLVTFGIGGGPASLKATPIVFTATGVQGGTDQVLETPISFAATRVTKSNDLGTMILANAAKAYRLSPNGSGGVAVESWDAAALPQDNLNTNIAPATWDGSYVGNWKSGNGKVYAGPTQTLSQVAEIDLPHAGAANCNVLASTPGITDFEVVGDQVFYAEGPNVYQFDTVTASAQLYSSGGETIQALE